MSKKQFRLPPTPKGCSSKSGIEKTESGSSRDSGSPIHWETLTGTDSQIITEIKPSSWDNSDDDGELPLPFEKNNSRGHIYSSQSVNNSKSVTAEINELKKQFFMAAVLETDTEPEIEDLREKLEMSLRNDRRKSPARVRRRTKSSSSSSTAMDITMQNSPKRGDELLIPYETTFDNMESIAPLLQLDSKFYLDKFFAELRRKRISVLESTLEISNERDDNDCQEILLEDSDDLGSLSDGGYYNRTSRKLSQILEVEENKKDSDKDGEENSESNDLFFKVSRKSADSDNSSLLTARSKTNEKFKKPKEKKDECKSSRAESANSKHAKSAREGTAIAIANELGNDFISLTAKTGTIHFDSPKRKDVKKNKADSHQIHDDDEDVNWNLIENLKLDLMKSPENSTPRKSSRRERNSDLSSKRSTKDGSLQSPKFVINVGQESSRSLKVEDIKTPNSVGRNSAAGSDRSIKNHTSSCGSTLREAEKNIFIDLKSPSLVSHSSNRSLELQDILLDHGMNTNRYSHRTSGENEIRDHEALNQLELPYGSNNNSESSSRSINSKSSRSSKSYRLLSRANERRKSSQRSGKAEILERSESARSSAVTPRTELELLRQTNMPQSGKSCDNSSGNAESKNSSSQELKITTLRTNNDCSEDIRSESENRCKTSVDNEGVLDAGTSEWVDVENIPVISSNHLEKFLKSQPSSRSEIIVSESLDKATQKYSTEELEQSGTSSRKLVIPENLNNADCISSTRSTKSKSRPDSYIPEEKTLLNISLNTEKSDEVKISGRTTNRINLMEECENTTTPRLYNDSDNEKRLSVINEVSSEEIKFIKIPENKTISKPSAGSQEREGRRTPKSHPASQRSDKNQASNKSVTKLEPEELWNDLIETFNEDKNQPFNWQDKFFGFLNTNQNNPTTSEKESSTVSAENVNLFNFKKEEEEIDDVILSRRLAENTLRPPQRTESSAENRPEKKENFRKNLDLGVENTVKEKIKTDNDVDNLYYFEVKKAGNFGIGEFGDVTCWNLGVSHALEEGKPKGDGDGIILQRHTETSNLNQVNTENGFKIQKESWMNLKDFGNNLKVPKFLQMNDDLNLLQFSQKELKPSKSDTCVSTIDFSQHKSLAFSAEKSNKSSGEQKQIFNVHRNRKRKAVSSISSVQYSSSECVSDETDNPELEFESVRRSASLTDIAAQLRRSGCEKPESNENLYSSRSPLFVTMAKERRNEDATNLNMFLARKKEKEAAEAKSNWLILKHSRGKTYYRENKKSKSRLKIDKNLIKKDSKEYLSFRSRHSIPVLKLRESNCFQNFYKRVISVFCLTSNSSLPTSK